MYKSVSIITVNFNGQKLLGNFLKSLQDIDYPKDLLEVIIVDNGSTDGSISFLRNNFPEVRVIEAGKNIGFGSANNLAIKKSNSDFFFLVNNDTVVDKSCLKEMIKTYEKWKSKVKIGAISAKTVLYDKYLPIFIRGALLHDYELPSVYKPLNNNIYSYSYLTGGQEEQETYIPINYNLEGSLVFNTILKKLSNAEFTVSLDKNEIRKGKFDTYKDYKIIRIKISKQEIRKLGVNLIQNAGNFMFRDGSSRDRGAIIYYGNEYYEPDRGQYDKEEIVPSFCGVAVLLNKECLDKVGLFDKSFFMYYEDNDLSLRMYQANWKVIYCPEAMVRHMHAASSIAWSSFFVFNAERGRLLLLSKHWPRIIALKEWLLYIIKDTVASPIYNIYFGEFRSALMKFIIRVKVNFSVAPIFLLNLLRRKRYTLSDLKHLL